MKFRRSNGVVLPMFRYGRKLEIRLASEREFFGHSEVSSFLGRCVLEGRHLVYPSANHPVMAYPNLISDEGGIDGNVAESDFTLFKAKDAFVAPSLGVVIGRSGDVFAHTFAEAKYLLGSISKLPRASEVGSSIFLDLPSEQLGASIISMPWGGLHNYGHFLLDCLPTIAYCRQNELLAGRDFVFPPLREWHRQHLRLLGLSSWRECAADLYRVREAIWSNVIDHFLHAPNPLLTLVRDIQLFNLGQAPSRGTSGSKIWLSRKGNGKRQFPRENELEARLASQGFTVVAPETLPVAEQIRLFEKADVVAGLTGAGFANIIYCRPSAIVVEIQPTLMRGVWVRNTAAQTGCRWARYVCPSTPPETLFVIGGQERPNVGISIDVDFADFENFLASLGVI